MAPSSGKRKNRCKFKRLTVSSDRDLKNIFTRFDGNKISKVVFILVLSFILSFQNFVVNLGAHIQISLESSHQTEDLSRF